MSSQNLRLAEAWFRLLADAARGTRTAQRTLRSLAERSLTPADIASRIGSFLPAGVAPPSEEAVGRWMESLWTRAGIVPRSRYLELLERYEALRERLEEAEVTIRKLRRLIDEGGHEKDAQNLLDIWSNAVGDTLQAHADWMRSWVPRTPEEAAARARPEPKRGERGRRTVRKGGAGRGRRKTGRG